MVTFTVPGPAATKGSTVSFMAKDGIVTKTDSRRLPAWSRDVGWAAKAAGVTLAPAGTGVIIRATFQSARPKAGPSRNRRYPTVRPDIDKMTRALLDALTGIAYEDDAQVVQLHVQKTYAMDALTWVQVEVAS